MSQVAESLVCFCNLEEADDRFESCVYDILAEGTPFLNQPSPLKSAALWSRAADKQLILPGDSNGGTWKRFVCREGLSCSGWISTCTHNKIHIYKCVCAWLVAPCIHRVKESLCTTSTLWRKDWSPPGAGCSGRFMKFNRPVTLPKNWSQAKSEQTTMAEV